MDEEREKVREDAPERADDAGGETPGNPPSGPARTPTSTSTPTPTSASTAGPTTAGEADPRPDPIETAADAMWSGGTLEWRSTTTYTNASLTASDGSVHSIGHAHWWATTARGERLLDISVDSLPAPLREELTGCQLHVRDGAGATVVAGRIEETSTTLGAFGLVTCVVPSDQP